MKQIIKLGLIVFQLFFLANCCSINPKKCKRNKMEGKIYVLDINSNNQIDLPIKDFNTLNSLLLKKDNFKPPFKKNPFLKDYEIIGGKNKIEFSTYNSKFKIISNNGGKDQIGQYDKYYKEVNKYLGIDLVKIETINKQKFNLLRIGSSQKRTDDPTIDHFPILNIKRPNLTKEDKTRLIQLILNKTKENSLYNFDNSYGNGAMFSPNIALRLKNKEDILISLTMYKVKFYKNNKNYQTIKIDPNSDEFKELLKLLKKYYKN